MASHTEREAPLTVRIPADVDQPDRIMAGLTARQLAIAATAASVLWLLYTATRGFAPLPVFAVVAIPAAGITAALVVGRKDGVTLDRLALAAVRHWRSPRRLVTARQVVPPPDWVTPDTPLPAPLRLPAQAIGPTGAVDLGRDGLAVVCVCSTVNFSLRTPGEQNALVGGFARWINSITGPAQLVVRADRIDLSPLITALSERAGGLPHPALEQAAIEHAGFLADLATSRDLLRRQILVVLREPVGPAAGRAGRDAAARRVLHRAEEATRALCAAGITVTALDGPGAAAVLAAACDPTGSPRPPGLTGPGTVITARRWR